MAFWIQKKSARTIFATSYPNDVNFAALGTLEWDDGNVLVMQQSLEAILCSCPEFMLCE